MSTWMIFVSCLSLLWYGTVQMSWTTHHFFVYCTQKRNMCKNTQKYNLLLFVHFYWAWKVIHGMTTFILFQSLNSLRQVSLSFIQVVTSLPVCATQASTMFYRCPKTPTVVLLFCTCWQFKPKILVLDSSLHKTWCCWFSVQCLYNLALLGLFPSFLP